MYNETIKLLLELVSTPSISHQEHDAADVMQRFLHAHGVKAQRVGNNLWAMGRYDANRPTLMLNSHIDTVKPSPSYTRDPYEAEIIDARLYGLGSNDASASVASLAATFCTLRDLDSLPVNLLLAISCEEEVSGEGGMRMLLPAIEQAGVKIDMAIVGEPTGMQPAIAERGLMVLDCVAHGKAGHAARNEGVNAIYRAIADIDILRNLQFPKVSEVLGPIKISVTQIEAGTQHNVVPDACRYVADVRTTDAYSNVETLEMISQAVGSEVNARSTRIHASVIAEDHPLVQAAVAYGGVPFVSPTTSDMALMPHIPSLKIGPGQSSRSHSADEYVELSEIRQALDIYPKLIKSLLI